MKLQIKKGATSNILEIFIADSSSTTGAGLTGLTQASGSLTAYYHRNTGTTATAITLVTMTVGTFTSSGFKEIDSANMPGWYQFCPPDAAFASGANSVSFHLKGATNMAPLPIEVQLVAFDPQDAAALGLSLLDAAISSRLASGSYTTPPTVAAIRAEMDSNSTKLANVDVAVSTRLATASYSVPPTATENADALLKRDMSAVVGEAGRSPLNALRAIRNKVSRSGAVLTVTKEDDTTTAWTAAITTDPTANAITVVDPA